MQNNDDTKILAFYLPQYHPIPENNQWWGEGFTEWTNVAKARPNYEGHYQPHIPRDLGFYDLRRTETFREQANLAKQYGIHGFCFYWYWFNGKQVLESPLYGLLNDKSIDLPFCFCWANENWTRTWDGQDKEILLKQEYCEEQLASDFIEKLIPFFEDSRYIKIDGKPVLLVYRADIIPKLEEHINRWRQSLADYGFKGIYLVAAYSFNISDHQKYGFDAGVEFPPHQSFSDSDVITKSVKLTNREFRGTIYDYRGAISNSLKKKSDDFYGVVYRSAFPCWDNTARRQHTGHIMHNSSPSLFQYWLTKLRRDIQNKPNSEFIFINAWNEWGEGCHLEPDQKHRHQFLEAVLNSYSPTDVDEDIKKEIEAYEAQRRKIDPIRYLKDKVKTVPFLYRLLLPIYSLMNTFR